MRSQPFQKNLAKVFDRTKLSTILLVPFVLQISVTVTLLAYLFYQNGNQSVHDLAHQLIEQVGNRITDKTKKSLEQPYLVHQTLLSAINSKTLNLDNFQQLQCHLLEMVIQPNLIDNLSFGNTQGEYVGIDRRGSSEEIRLKIKDKSTNSNLKVYSINKQCQKHELLTDKPLNLASRPWYKTGVNLGNARSTWSPIVLTASKQKSVMSTVTSVYSADRKLLGVIHTEVDIKQVNQVLRSLESSHSIKAFAIERNGKLVASSSGISAIATSKQFERLLAKDSEDPIIRDATAKLLEQFGSFGSINPINSFDFEQNGEHFFAHVTNLQDGRGLDWLIVVTVPEHVFIGQINANTYNTIALCLLAFCVSVGVGIVISRSITRPILSLNEAAKEVAEGNFQFSIEVKSFRELNQLAESFNGMTAQLQASFNGVQSLNDTLTENEKQLANYNQNLEKQVQKRTQELAQTLQQLQSTQDFIDCVINTIRDPIFVKDRRFRWIMFNNAFCQLMGHSQAELLGKSDYDFFSQAEADIFREKDTLVFTTGIDSHNEENLTDATGVVHIISTKKSLLIDAFGSEVIVGVIRDITDRKLAEIALRDREEMLRQKNEELTIALEQLQLAQEELVQSEKMAALGQLVAGIAHEINTPLGAIQASIGNIVSALEQSMENLPQILQKLPAESLAEFFTLLEIAKQPKQSLSFREERQLKRTLKQTLQSKEITNADTLADSLSRMGISSELDSLMSLLESPDNIFSLETAYQLSAVQNNSQNIQLAVDRAAKIVFALKNYARQGCFGEMISASVIDGIETVLTIYHNQLKQGIEVTKQYDNVVPILCYPEELTQVWTNLIHNAIQAMDGKGKLLIVVTEKDGFVVVSIIDNGSGIPPEIQEKIFQPFFTTKPAGEGSGLGLDIVRKIIDKHQGKIELESQPGNTQFSISLPIKSNE